MVEGYMILFTVAKEKSACAIFNAGYESESAKELTGTVKSVAGEEYETGYHTHR